ncbi:CBS domain-containing protein [Jatrophihabitans endophyticus]|uniref:CBS domain-containing protein n=1 Tax=Jatrophihabitans endophyticus TaxID=1206085 RepID=A0A1M5S464_9ACTN|nr:CBS domain-containing protein [Jatrophihabitans endophyticus]SHH33269.1 CBS domain-containing protein [Jatrophihabitans endophyticus]
MRAGDIMTREVVTVTPQTPVNQAIALLTRHAIASLPVVEDGEVVGIVSEPDLLRNRLPHDPAATMRPRPDGPDPGRTVEDVMNEPVLCLPTTADAADVAQVLLDNHVRAVPIVDGADLVGIVSRRDLLRLAQRDDRAIAAAVVDLLDRFAEGTRTTGWRVQADDGIVTVAGTFVDQREEGAVYALAHSVPGVVRVHVVPA